MVRIDTGLLLSHKKELNSAICKDMDRSGDCHTEWSKSEEEKQISHKITCMWNLEKWYRYTYLQSRNRDTYVENKLRDTKGKGCCDELGVWDWHIHTTMYKIDN